MDATELTELEDDTSTGKVDGMTDSHLNTTGIQLGGFGEVATMTAETVDFLIRVLEDRKQELLVNDEDKLHVKANYAVAEEDEGGASEETAPSPHRQRLPFDSVNNSGAGDGATVTELMTQKLQIPVVSIIPGIGEAVRQQLASTAAPCSASKLYQSSKLEIVDLPVPVVCPPNASNNHQPQDAIGKDEPTTPSWKLDPIQQQILEDAEVLFIDAHLAAPLLLDPKRNLPFEMQHLLKKVKWVQGTYAGVDSYHQFPEAPADPGFTVTRAGGIMPTALAQFVFGWVIALERKFFDAQVYQEKRVFGRWDLKYRSFRQVTIGILGLGEIGQEVGRTLKASGFQVIGFKRKVNDENRKALASSADRVSSDMHEVLEQSDYVVNVLPSTDATRYLLTENTLEVCSKKKPVFINVGRGDVVAVDTIVNALDKGLLSKAVLDVFEQEPLPKESPLWSHPKVIVTPHISGSVFPEDVADVFVKNLCRRLEGQQLIYQMDWSNGY
ncbi:hypothetical protein BBJ29_000920 [Phytophthora kernoviae]|uniref:D-isomer specific 2-hydroxyacid dehydrogenase NAD-binding domain-containing protein n=1 Tax=Phytophthora kernoviae TaxID=325452 RepID=A0A3F2RW71_9STRA|nr:hypothetical protein BBJ29_000920 [Phytophthora kernoviae]RLN65420.1 hypothetical protein BBP00_00002855 [Phytophthora kernoviae]